MTRYVPSPEEEKNIGIDYYATSFRGIGGRTRTTLSDFIVDEIYYNVYRASSLRPENLTCKPGKYALYLVEKRGITTYRAALILARELGVSPSIVSFSGLKDARSIAYQIFSVKTSKNSIIKERVLHPKCSFTFIGLCNKPLRRGFHSGNYFKITIRDVEEPATSIIEFLEEVEVLEGLPNFYGHQRFGTIRPITHLVGKHIIARNWEDAVVCLVGEHFPGESSIVREARMYFKDTMDPKKTLSLMPRSMVYERIVLRRLIKKPGKYRYAIKGLPTKMIKLFIEAFQSYIYNKTLSKRMGLGLRPDEALPGDVVYMGNKYTRTDKGGKIGKNSKILIPLIGYETHLNKRSYSHEIILSILEELNVKPEMFNLVDEGLPSLRGGFRATPFTPLIKNFNEENGTLVLEMFLEKGVYATIVLRELMKTAPWTFC